MNAQFLLTFRLNSRPVLNLDEVCEATGYQKSTAYNELSAGTFPIPMHKCGKRLFADVRDVANYIDFRRADAQDRHSALWRKIGIPEWTTADDDPLTREDGARQPSSLFLLLGMFDCAVMLSLDQICDATGYKKPTAYVASRAGKFPVPLRMCGKRLWADVRDVASYLDSSFGIAERETAFAMEAYALLSMRFGPGLMDLDTVCLAIAWEKSTAYNAISSGNFPVFMRKFGRSWMADPRDVGFFLDEERHRFRQPVTLPDEARSGSDEMADVEPPTGAGEEQSLPATDLPPVDADTAKPAPLERPRSGKSAQEAIRAILRRKAQRMRK